jgi:branched-chain amino acid aminotransferase
LRIVVETVNPRTTPQFGVVKSGANYAMALSPLMAAKREWQADQVLFAPGGLIEETGAANFVLLDEGNVITSALSDAFLHGVTRDSVLQVARSLGWNVEERDVSVDELREWAARPSGEMALSGTAAILGGVGELVIDSEIVTVGTGQAGPATTKLRAMLTEIQQGVRDFSFT